MSSSRMENGNRIKSSLEGETLRKRRNVIVGLIQFHALDAMHRKEDYTGSCRIPGFYHGDQIFERSQFDAREAEPLAVKVENHAPELFPRIAQRHQHHDAGLKGIPGIGGNGGART